MTAPVQPGEILAGKYKVERVLGVGGMGVVVSAIHLELDEKVALKFMLEEALANEEAVERFKREARAAIKIKSEHVARVTDTGKLDNGAPYMVMEYLEGQDLSAVLEVRGSLPVEEAAEYVLQACEAIAEAHALGIVHRDLKPANLFLAARPDGTRAIKVLDFGISKHHGGRGGSRPEMSLTKTTSVMGSPFYMAPEQMRSTKNVDARTDIWAIGIILHELIAGKAVFDAATMPELCAKILSDEPEPLSKLRPGIAVGIEGIVLRCLDKSADRRFQSIGQLATALAEFAPPRAAVSVERIHRVLEKAGIPVGPMPSQPAIGAKIADEKTGDGARAVQSATMGTWNTHRVPPGKNSPKAIIAGMLIALVLGAGITVFLARGGSTPRSAVGVTATPTAEVMPKSSAAPQEPRTTPTATAAEPVVSPAATATAALPSAVPSATQAPVASARPVTDKPAAPKPTAKPAVTKPKADLFSEPK